jgi:hypothetical protein
MIEVKVIGDKVVAADLGERIPKVVRARVAKAIRFSGARLRTRIMANASGRPGPNAPTGDYRRSWGPPSIINAGDSYSVEVGTNAPQGRRLEFGFHGVDSLGRHYDQPAFPHVGPAVDAIAPVLAAELTKAVTNL